LFAGLLYDYAFGDEGRLDGERRDADDGTVKTRGDGFRDADLPFFLLLRVHIHHDVGEAHCGAPESVAMRPCRALFVDRA
jgi:hypothetical protein